MVRYRVYEDDREWRVELHGWRVYADVGPFETRKDVEKYLEWCRGSRWDGETVLKKGEDPEPWQTLSAEELLAKDIEKLTPNG